MCVCVFWCVQGLFLSMPVIVPVCGSLYQPGTIHRWENVTNYPTGISHKHTCWFKVSPENLYMCCNTHTHTHTHTHTQTRWFKVSPENLYMCCNTHTHTHTHTHTDRHADSRSLLRISTCAVTHTHTQTRWFKVSPENLYMCCNTHTHTHADSRSLLRISICAVTHTHTDSRSLLRISTCAVSHTHNTHICIHARSCSDVQIQLDVCIYIKKSLTSCKASTPPKDEHR